MTSRYLLIQKFINILVTAPGTGYDTFCLTNVIYPFFFPYTLVANINTLPKEIFGGTIIPFFNKVKNFGIIIDSSLSWSPNLQEVSRNIIASLIRLRRFQNFLPHAIKITLAQSFSYLSLTTLMPAILILPSCSCLS